MEDPADHEEAALPQTCASCGKKLKGNYCYKCGEKSIAPERDFSLDKFFQQTLWHFIHFDSKLLKTSWLLFSKPGFLTAEWIAGRRVGYMKPFQIFVVASVFFYFFLPTATAYFTGYRDLVKGYEEHKIVMNVFQYDFKKALAEKTVLLHLDEETLKSNIITRASQQSKTWLFLIIPFWGAWIYLFFKQKIPWLVPHLIFAMHGLTAYILMDLASHALIDVWGFKNTGKYIFLLLTIVFPVYQALAAYRVYQRPWPETILKTTFVAAGFIVLLLLYRQLMTIWAVATL